MATPAFAVNPPGNNGTIKIDDVAFDSHPDNEPHVGCVFQVDFYGYDEGDLTAEVTFETHPPTEPDKVLLTDTVDIGEDDNSGGGSETGLDASETYTLDFTGITPHAQQGFHVKLTINAEGSQGADVKHKVFWVEGCGPTPTPTPTKPTPTTTTTPPSPTPTKTTHSPSPTTSTTPPSPTATTTTHTPSPSTTTTAPSPSPTESSEAPVTVPTAVPAGMGGAGSGGDGGSATGLGGLVLALTGAVAGLALIARRRFLHES